MGLRKSKIKVSDIDADGNGILTREEVHLYVTGEVNKWRAVYDERLDDWRRLYEEKLQEKEQEVEEWKTSYDRLHQKHSELLEQMRQKAYKRSNFLQKTSSISPEAIETVVEHILADPNLNLKKVPDWIEKKLYHNLIWVTLMAVEKIMGSIRIDALGHEFYLAMTPSLRKSFSKTPSKDMEL